MSKLPLLCASIWEVELTVTLQTGQWRWDLPFLRSLSSDRVSPFVLDASPWLPDSFPLGPIVSMVSGASGVLVSEAVSESCEEGDIWGGESVTSSTDETSDTGVSITELLVFSSIFTSKFTASRSDWRPARKCNCLTVAYLRLFWLGSKQWALINGNQIRWKV